MGETIDYIFYIYYTAYKSKAKKMRWYSSTVGRKENTLRGFTGMLTLYGIIILFMFWAYSEQEILQHPYVLLGMIAAWLVIVFFIDHVADKRYTYEKLTEMDEKYQDRISVLKARIIVGTLLVAPFAVMFLLSQFPILFS